MATQILAVIAGLFTIIIGIWKYFSRQRRRQEEAAKEIKDGIDKKDPSVITGGFDNLNR